MLLEGRQTKKHCFLAMFSEGGQTKKHCFLVMFPEGRQTKEHCFLAMFPEGRQTKKHCFLAMFSEGGQTRKHCFLAMFSEGGQTRKHRFSEVRHTTHTNYIHISYQLFCPNKTQSHLNHETSVILAKRFTGVAAQTSPTVLILQLFGRSYTKLPK